MSTWRPTKAEAGPRRVGESLAKVVRRFGGEHSDPTALTAVFTQWHDIAGAQIAAHAKPRSLAGGTLVVVVDDPAWATQLTFLGADLVRRCSEIAGAESVQRVEVRVAGAKQARNRGGRR